MVMRPSPATLPHSERAGRATDVGSDVIPTSAAACRLSRAAASVIADLGIIDVGSDRKFSDIWYESAVSGRFRGTDWRRELCGSCRHREVDFGGCGCQAYRLTGDAAHTDPVCSLSPDRQ
jgi:radical SAM protein with 4Fe4S-binding SPASM domain